MAPTGAEALQYGTGEKSCLSQPRGLHVDAAGQLYVADFGNSCVLRFSADGAALQVLAGERGKQLMDVDYLKDIDKPLALPDGEGVLLKNPIDVALDSDGGLLVLDCPMGRVQRFDGGQKGSAAQVLIPPPKSMPAKSLAVPEAIKHPRSMLHHADGSLVICDTWSHRVLKYSKDALTPEVLAGTPNSCGCSESQLNFPSFVAFEEDGALLVADTNNHRIQRFRQGELRGETVAGSAEGKSGNSLTELCMPTGLVVEKSGSFLVADRGNQRVLRFRGGEAELVLGPDLLKWPWGLAVDQQGNIFVSDEKRGVVLKLPESGLASTVRPLKLTKAPAPEPKAAPKQVFQPPERTTRVVVPQTAPERPERPAVSAAPITEVKRVFQPPERQVAAAAPPKAEEVVPKDGLKSKMVGQDPLGLDSLD